MSSYCEFIKSIMRCENEQRIGPCPRCGAKNSHAIFSHNEKVTANGRTNYVRLIGIRCDDCGFSVDGYLRTIEAVRKWNALEVAE